jgi:hypothetical protein
MVCRNKIAFAELLARMLSLTLSHLLIRALTASPYQTATWSLSTPSASSCLSSDHSALHRRRAPPHYLHVPSGFPIGAFDAAVPNRSLGMTVL